MSRRRRFYRRMTPHEFNAALGRLEISKTHFAKLTGMAGSRVERMAHGDDGADIPHLARLALALMALPDGLTMARRIAAECIEETT
jgi:hypothetical protein